MQKMIKQILAALCASVICGTLVVLCVTNQSWAQAAESAGSAGKQYAYIADRSVYFYDVNQKYNWAYLEIDHLATLDIVRGSDKYLFQPDKSITRADFVLMLYRAYDMKKYVSGQYFKDVKPGDYYAEAVLAARNLGIVKGTNGYFYPKKSITRQEAMVMLERTLQAARATLPTASLSGYADAARVAAYAKTAVGELAQAGIVGGTSGRIDPTSTVSRAQMAVMLYRALMVETDSNGVSYYKEHPERVDLCIGGKIYSGATIVNYDASKSYAGLVSYTAFEQTDNGHQITLGDTSTMDQKIVYENGTLTVDGKTVKMAQDCVGVCVAPYSELSSLVSTGSAYIGGRVSMNADGKVDIVYYTK